MRAVRGGPSESGQKDLNNIFFFFSVVLKHLPPAEKPALCAESQGRFEGCPKRRRSKNVTSRLACSRNGVSNRTDLRGPEIRSTSRRELEYKFIAL